MSTRWLRRIEGIADACAKGRKAELIRIDGIGVLVEGHTDEYLIRFWRPKVNRDDFIKLWLDGESLAVLDEQHERAFVELVQRECEHALDLLDKKVPL